MFGKRKRHLQRILIVEDEPLVAFDNEHFLISSGFEVVATVDRADDALRIIGEETVDLVLADINLTDGLGTDVARAAHEKGVRVLFVTGACPSDAERFAVGALGKPYSQRDLLDAIEVVEAAAAGRRSRRVPRALRLFGEQ